jgi:hypothetical protein
VAANVVDDRKAEAGRWSWSVALTSGMTIQNEFGVILPSVDVISFPAGTREPGPFREPATGSHLSVVPYVGLGAEVMAPEFDSVPGDPRLFLNAEFIPSFAPVSQVAGEGVASIFILPERLENDPQFFLQEQISGPGSRLTAQTMTVVIAAALGVAFPFEVRDRYVRVKPTVGWIRYGVVTEGLVNDVYKDDIPGSDPAIGGANIRFVTLHDRGSDFFNGIGPGLEIEVELGRFGSIRPAIYMDGHAYRLLGNQTITLHDGAYFNDALGEAIYRATWRFRVDDWMFRAGLAVRIRWVGAK